MKLFLPLFVITLAMMGCSAKVDSPAAKPVVVEQPATEPASAPAANDTTAATTSKATIMVAAAADLRFALEELTKSFQAVNPEIEVKSTFGSSGSLFAQLTNKAPFDFYLSADLDYPRKLIEEGFAAKETEFVYAIGEIGIWVRKESPLDLDKLGIQALNDPSVKKVAIANPKVAPYGRAAEAALHHFRIYDAVKDRLVIGENISQTAQFVESGAADVGLIAHSLALAPALREAGRYWALPKDSHPKLTQGGVILNSATHPAACEKLKTFLTTEPGQTVLSRFGFETPGQ